MAGAVYSVTQSIVGTAVFAVTLGVRQGSPTCCLLFVLYVNELNRLIKCNCEDDGFLKRLHVLILVDDTVLLSSSRERMIIKLSLLKRFCSGYGMKVRVKKQFFCNTRHPRGQRADAHRRLGGGAMCSVCVHLDSPFTADGSVSSLVRAHADAKMPHAIKFVSFLNNNNVILFRVKRRIFKARLVSTILYGCESWINADLRPIKKLYNWSLKNLLDVRLTTCNDVCYVDSAYPHLHSLVGSRQRSFFSKMWRERQGMEVDPLVMLVNNVMENNYQTWAYTDDLLCRIIDDIDEGFRELKANIVNSTSSKRVTYINKSNFICSFCMRGQDSR